MTARGGRAKKINFIGGGLGPRVWRFSAYKMAAGEWKSLFVRVLKSGEGKADRESNLETGEEFFFLSVV